MLLISEIMLTNDIDSLQQIMMFFKQTVVVNLEYSTILI